MNIDLLFTKDGEGGLISSDNPVKKVAGVVLDTQNGMISYEFADMDVLDLNIPVDSEFFEAMESVGFLHIGSFKNDHIGQAYQVPLMFSDDPYRGQTGQHSPPPENPLTAFSYFIKNCIAGQPVHREDLGDEENMGCILGDAVPSSLEFAPHLARRHGLEAAPTAAPSMGGPATPGMGGGGGGGMVSGGGHSGGAGSAGGSGGKQGGGFFKPLSDDDEQ